MSSVAGLLSRRGFVGSFSNETNEFFFLARAHLVLPATPNSDHG